MDASIMTKDESGGAEIAAPGEMLEPLTSLNKDEFRDVLRQLRPELEDEEFDAKWESFQEMKRQRGLRNEQ